MVINCLKSCHPTQINIPKDSSSYFCIAEIGSGETGPVKISSRKTSFSEISSPKTSLVKNDAVKVGSLKVSLIEIWSYIWMFVSPLVPYFHSLPKQINMLLICHTG